MLDGGSPSLLDRLTWARGRRFFRRSARGEHWLLRCPIQPEGNELLFSVLYSLHLVKTRINYYLKQARFILGRDISRLAFNRIRITKVLVPRGIGVKPGLSMFAL